MPCSTSPYLDLKCLTEEEFDNPELVFTNFFDIARLPEIKEWLEEIKRQLVERSYPFAADSIEREKVVEAAWMMR